MCAVIPQGFLPEEIDNFIVDYIYPSFSIQVGVVFACSTVYGLWKASVIVGVHTVITDYCTCDSVPVSPQSYCCFLHAADVHDAEVRCCRSCREAGFDDRRRCV